MASLVRNNPKDAQRGLSIGKRRECLRASKALLAIPGLTGLNEFPTSQSRLMPGISVNLHL